MEKKIDVFISYKSQNQSVADMLRSCLQSEGIDCWIASHDVKPGTDYAEEIVRAIERSKVLLLVLTKEANQDHRQIRRELSLADSAGKVIVPVRVEPIDPSPAFQYVLATCQVLNLYDDNSSFSDAQASKVVRAVKYHLDQALVAPVIDCDIKSADLQFDNTEMTEHIEYSSNVQASLDEQNDGVSFNRAVQEARTLRSKGSSKMQAAEVIFKALIGERRSVIIRAFMNGAELSHAGASTYYQTLKSRFGERHSFD